MFAVRLLGLLAALTLGGGEALAGARWGFSASLGAAWSVPTPLVIRQAGQPDLRLQARWAGEPFRRPWYYVLRVERSEEDVGWALAFVHHKLHLANPPADVEGFDVSHGYNLLIAERSWRGHGARMSLGAGLVIAHPENEVRGRKLAEPGGLFGGAYRLGGPVLGGALAREIPLRGRWVLPLEGRATAAWARVPVAGGHASVPNVALHGLAGIGWR